MSVSAERNLDEVYILAQASRNSRPKVDLLNLGLLQSVRRSRCRPLIDGKRLEGALGLDALQGCNQLWQSDMETKVGVIGVLDFG